jgi:hypothetical protein
MTTMQSAHEQQIHNRTATTESLEAALHTANFTAESLHAALTTATATEAIVIMPMIGEARALATRIDELLSAIRMP